MGEPITSKKYPRGFVNQSPLQNAGRLVITDLTGRPKLPHELVDNQNYRIKTLVTTYPGFQWLYLTETLGNKNELPHFHEI